MILRNYQSSTWNNHCPDNQGKQNLSSWEAESCNTKGQCARNNCCKYDSQNGYHKAVQEVQIELFLIEYVDVVLQRYLAKLREKVRRILIKCSIGLQRSADHIDHRQDRKHTANEQKTIKNHILNRFLLIYGMHICSPHSTESPCCIALN